MLSGASIPLVWGGFPSRAISVTQNPHTTVCCIWISIVVSLTMDSTGPASLSARRHQNPADDPTLML